MTAGLWTSMYDLVVIGGGPAGYIAAIRAAQRRMKVALVEKERLGGICVNWGCIPSKALLESARLIDEIQRDSRSSERKTTVRPDWQKLLDRAKNEADSMSAGVGYFLEKNGVEVIHGFASFLTPTLIRITSGVTERDIIAKDVIIAVGAQPRGLPELLPYDGENVVNSTQAMNLATPPKQLVVFGGGTIGCEFGYLFSVMGSDVTIVEETGSLLGWMENDVSAEVERSFSGRGIQVLTGSTLQSVERGGAQWQYRLSTPAGERLLSADLALVATGVTVNLERLGLERAGVKLSGGFIKVDNRMRTNIANIYAVGDCSGPPLLAHIASQEAIVAVDVLSGVSDSTINRDRLPAVCYFDPPIGLLGHTTRSAKNIGLDIKVRKYLLFQKDVPAESGREIGFAKFIGDSETGELLGVHLVGGYAPEFINHLAVGGSMEGAYAELTELVRSHPEYKSATLVEVEASSSTAGKLR